MAKDITGEEVLGDLVFDVLKVFLFWLIWNNCIPYVFRGTPFIDGWAALGIVVLAGLATAKRTSK